MSIVDETRENVVLQTIDAPPCDRVVHNYANGGSWR